MISMNYIEANQEGEFFNPASGTVQINPPEGEPSDPIVEEYNENLMRWEWLIKGWPDMSFRDRMALFIPYVRIVRLINQKVDDFDEYINDEIIDTQYMECRTFSELKYDEDNHGSPCFTLIFDPINISAIPDFDTRRAVETWGSRFGFIKDRPPMHYVPHNHHCSCNLD